MKYQYRETNITTKMYKMLANAGRRRDTMGDFFLGGRGGNVGVKINLNLKTARSRAAIRA